jgi:hypothetical protein
MAKALAVGSTRWLAMRSELTLLVLPRYPITPAASIARRLVRSRKQTVFRADNNTAIGNLALRTAGTAVNGANLLKRWLAGARIIGASVGFNALLSNATAQHRVGAAHY